MSNRAEWQQRVVLNLPPESYHPSNDRPEPVPFGPFRDVNGADFHDRRLCRQLRAGQSPLNAPLLGGPTRPFGQSDQDFYNLNATEYGIHRREMSRVQK